MRLAVFLASLAFIVLVGTAGAQDSETKKSVPDPEKGATLAQRWCASCHIVSPGQRSGIDGTPSFAAIAGRENFNVEKLAFFLLDPHPVMPRMALSRNEARDLAAYIAKQRAN